MDVYDIVSVYLNDNGFDGLYRPGDCACKLDDLAPCGEMRADCEAGYLKKVDNCLEHDFHIGAKNSDNDCGESD